MRVKGSLKGDKPIYLQIKEGIEDQILQGELKEGDQIPSTNEMVRFYKVNHLTVSKGMNLLFDDGIIFKKRGVGMFVEKGAREKLLEQRKEIFQDQYILPLLREAEKIGLEKKDLIKMIDKKEGE
ncbi:GntR family transcriptional regulator [Isachenkonia alkalipeptolytica]|uniref:GntR family transcriptional regulator n=1 Tax=Isachenkonia alkalipeptolytica TaxID=2565777 RepID=A0AA43XJX6_9CLOT|nr:GntR family transcriptional regulator [Isachenkonia alkalipeptolytica]